MKTTCHHCKEELTEGYTLNELINVCEVCLDEHVSDDEYNQMYDEGNAYWTEFD